ncbi:cyclin-L1-like [Mercenaria mercenaria]|uniref:cyclin-L1-like n=1 Tax=Mercenaria mercenaria TaxID=6596 RepID=UPI00234F1FD7|nr:cyclin-L1-like [Mercenaria mercenaria]
MATMERDFSKVILTLENVLIPDEKLSPTPSMQDGLDLETETDLRILGCELIQTAGILLKLPQVAMATGQVLFQRFYYSKSFVKHNMEVLAMACVNLASKIEECPRRNRDVINTFHHVKQVRNQKNIHPMVLDQNYINLKNQVIKAERRVLKELGFCVHVKHPHKVIVMYLQVLESNQNQKLVQCAWNYMNDSFRTDVFVRYNPETIACACIWLAARQLQVPLPNSPPWLTNPKLGRSNSVRIAARSKKNAKGLFSERDTPNSTSRQKSSHKQKENCICIYIAYFSDGSKKRRNGISRSRSRSRSRSSRSRSSRSYSPAPKKRKRRSLTPVRKSKKDKYSPDRRSSKDIHKSRKRKHRSRSRSYSYSPSPEYKSSHKKRSKDKDRDYKDRDYKENKDRYYSPDRHSRKHRNGHHLSPSRDRSDKYDKYDKYDKMVYRR